MADTKRRAGHKGKATDGPARKKATGRMAMPSTKALKATATVRTKGGVTIPLQLREEVDLKEGDQVIVTVQNGNIVLTPASVIPSREMIIWENDELRASLLRGLADSASGRVNQTQWTSVDIDNP